MTDEMRQLSFLSLPDDEPPMGLTLVKQCEWVLRKHKKARDDYRLQTVLVWTYFYNLSDNLGSLEAFTLWYTDPKVPMAKTIRERTREIQKANADLQPSPSVKAERKRKSRCAKVPGT